MDQTKKPEKSGKKGITICKNCTGYTKLDCLLIAKKIEKIVDTCPNCPSKKRGREESTATIGTPTKKADSKVTPTKMSAAASSSSGLTEEETNKLLSENEGDMDESEGGGTSSGNQGDPKGTQPMVMDNNAGEGGSGTTAPVAGAPNGDGTGALASTSYANVVKETTKNVYPYAVQLHKGRNKRDHIGRLQFEAFVEKYTDLWFNLSPEESDKVVIKGTSFKDGIGYITCTNIYTSQWIKKVAEEFIWNKISCRAWSIWERPEAEVCYGILQGSYWKNTKADGTSMVKKILQKNQLKGSFLVLDWNQKHQYGTYFAFEPEESLLKALKEKSNLNCGNCTISISFYLRKQRSEAQVLAAAEIKRKNAKGAAKSSKSAKAAPSDKNA